VGFAGRRRVGARAAAKIIEHAIDVGENKLVNGRSGTTGVSKTLSQRGRAKPGHN
jgi:hypothetical protein